MHKVLLILASTFILTSCAKKVEDPAVQFDEDISSEIDTSDIKQEPNYPEQPLPNKLSLKSKHVFFSELV